MRTPRDGGPTVAWAAGGVVLAVGTVAAAWLGSSGASDPLTGSLAWVLSAPITIAGTFATAVWNAFSGDSRLARWLFGVAASVALYWLGAAAGGRLISTGATSTGWFTVTLAVTLAGWTLVLAAVQATCIVAGQQLRVLPRRRWPLALLLGSAATVLLSAVVMPPRPDGVPTAPSLVPESILLSPAAQLLSAILINGWTLSLLLAPIVLLILAVRSSGLARLVRARIAIGAFIPALVVLLAGLLASLVAETVTPPRGTEASSLAIGFTLGTLLAAVWITATVREASSSNPNPLTSVANIMRLALWTLYVLGVVQVVALFSPALGGSAAAGAIAMALVIGTTIWPWTLVVRWCLQRTDARTAIAVSAVRAAAARTDSAAVVAERALRDALGDVEARVLIARPGGRWTDSAGLAAERPQDGGAAWEVTDTAGTMLGVVTHHVRFADLRPVSSAVRPLFERAVWEAEVREQSKQAAAERRRADQAAAEAQRRIERDLHDGVQGRLVSLGLGLSMARSDLEDPVSRGILDETILSLQSAVLELRELASGTVSQRLSAGGLASAVGDLVARMPIPVSLDIRPPAIGAATESTAYFVIAESLTNVVKHARARNARVAVTGDTEVLIAISDDGEGGADVRAGTGLRGLQERVHSVGGRLVVSDRVPRGTLVEAMLPCGS